MSVFSIFGKTTPDALGLYETGELPVTLATGFSGFRSLVDGEEVERLREFDDLPRKVNASLIVSSLPL